jgi:dCTP diphosphatase
MALFASPRNAKAHAVSADSQAPSHTASLAQLAQRLQQFADARDWGQFHSPKNLASALIVEAGELLEHFQWMTEAQSRSLDADKKQAVAHEMADVLLYLVQLSSALGVDLMAAADQKMAINEHKYPIEQARGNSNKYDAC